MALSYPGQMAKTHDPDRFLATMFAPAAHREGLWVLLAVNYEIAKTRDTVSDPMIGQIRLQWWREAIDEAYAGTPKQHQLVEPLAALLPRYGWSQQQFDRLIDTREADLQGESPADLAALEAYACDSSYPLIFLMAQTLGVDIGEGNQVSEALSYLATAYAIAGILRAMAFTLNERYVPLPQDMMAAHGTSASRIADFPHDDQLRPLIKRVAENAESHLQQARAMRQYIPRSLRPLCLLGVSVQQTLNRLQARDYDVLDQDVVAASPLQPLAYYWANLTGRW
ncbi:MAG: phytoene/squalene synthase family protein [Pseudomonadota bacterium]